MKRSPTNSIQTSKALLTLPTTRSDVTLRRKEWIEFDREIHAIKRGQPVRLNVLRTLLYDLTSTQHLTTHLESKNRTATVAIHPHDVLSGPETGESDYPVHVFIYRSKGEHYISVKRAYEFIEVDGNIGVTFSYGKTSRLQEFDIHELYDLITLRISQRLTEYARSPENRRYITDFYLGSFDRQGYSYHLHDRHYKTFSVDGDRFTLSPNGRMVYQNESSRLVIRLMLSESCEFSISGVLSLRFPPNSRSTENPRLHTLRYEGPVESLPSDFTSLFHVSSEHLKNYHETQMLSIDVVNDFHLWLWWLQSMSPQLDGQDVLERRIVRSTLLQAVNSLRRLPTHSSTYVPPYWTVIDRALAIAGYTSDKPDVPEWMPILSKTNEQRTEMHQITCQMFRYVYRNLTPMNIEILYGLVNSY